MKNNKIRCVEDRETKVVNGIVSLLDTRSTITGKNSQRLEKGKYYTGSFSSLSFSSGRWFVDEFPGTAFFEFRFKPTIESLSENIKVL